MEDKQDDEFKDFKSPWYPFYYNPKDKRIFVPKLVGVGLTLNFGNPWAWVFVVGLTVLPIGIILILYK